MKYLPLLICSFLLNSVMAQNQATGIFEGNIDIGNPKKAGFSVYNSTDQSYSLKGSGYNIWFARDEFHYLYNKLKGDFILTANFGFAGDGTEPHRKAGWMLRASTDEDSQHISATIHGDGLTVMQWRDYKGAEMKDPEDEIFASDSGYPRGFTHYRR